MINISLVILAKDEAHCIADCIHSAKPVVNEILVINDHSTDDTVSIATMAGATKIIDLPFTVRDKGFATAANFMVEQATHDWILIIDADEMLAEDGHRLHVLTRYPGKEVWALPRRKWDYYPYRRMEWEAYPDWQVRFFKKGSGRFVGEMHVKYDCDAIHHAYSGPHVEHLQAQGRTETKLVHRNILYPNLALIQGVQVEGGDLLRIK